MPVILLSARAGEEARVEGLDAGADDYLVKPFAARELLARVRSNLELARIRREAAEQLRDEARRLELLNRTGSAIAAELDLERLVQTVTDAAVELTGAEFGAFFYNVLERCRRVVHALYAVRCAARGVRRLPDAAQHRRCSSRPSAARASSARTTSRAIRATASNAPYYGMPKGHLPVRSYLAVPVVSRSGEVLGGLFFGHPETGVFTERDELIVGGIAAQAAIAIDNARLYRASRQAQESLRGSTKRLEQRVAGRDRRTHAHRGSAAAGAEDGGRRPADRRRRARLQQPAHGDLRRRGYVAAPVAAGRSDRTATASGAPCA